MAVKMPIKKGLALVPILRPTEMLGRWLFSNFAAKKSLSVAKNVDEGVKECLVGFL